MHQKDEVLEMTDKRKDAMQEHYIKKVFMALANQDDKAFWSAVHELADLREERPDMVLFKLYEGLKQDNWKLIEVVPEYVKLSKERLSAKNAEISLF